MSQSLPATPFDPEVPEVVPAFRELMRNALVQGVFENNLRLARTLSEWGGPYSEAEIVAHLQQVAFGEPAPALPYPDPSAPMRPGWRQVPPGSRVPLDHLEPSEREGWVRHVSEDLQAMAKDPKKTVESYINRPDTGAGHIVSGDTLLHMLGTVQENPVLGLAAFRYVETEALAGLTILASCLRDRAMDLAGSQPVLLMAGGQGSGKTTVAQYLMRAGWEGAIFDSPWVTERDIRTVRNRGHEAWIIYIDRDFEGAFISMIDRAADEGRMVNPCDMARTHAQVPSDLLRASALFRNQPRVSLWHIQNRNSDVRNVDILGGPLHREGKDAFSSIHHRKESRDRLAYEGAAQACLQEVQQALQSGQRNPYPVDLLVEIRQGLHPEVVQG